MRLRSLLVCGTTAALLVPALPSFAAAAPIGAATSNVAGSQAPSRSAAAATTATVVGTVTAIDKRKLTVTVKVTVPAKGKTKATTKSVAIKLGARATLSRNGSAATLDALAVGDTVTATLTGGKATRINALVRGWVSREVSGKITAVNAAKRTVTLATTGANKKVVTETLTVNAKAVITARGVIGSFSDVVVGDSVSATVGGVGKNVSLIRLNTTAPPVTAVTVTGVVTAVAPSTGKLTVRTGSGKAVKLVTLPIGLSDRVKVGSVPSRLADIPVGSAVRVRATLTGTDSYDVSDVVATDDNRDTTTIRALITSVDADALTVTVAPVEDRGDPVTLPIDAAAVVTYNGETAALQDVPANSPATIRVRITNAGTVIVGIEASAPKQTAVTVVGTLLTVDTTRRTIAVQAGDRAGEGALRTFTVASDVTVKRGTATSSLADLRAGDRVTLTVTRATGGTRAVTAIVAVPAPTSRITIQGALISPIGNDAVVKVALPSDRGNGLTVKSFALAADAGVTRDGFEVAPGDLVPGDLLTLTLSKVNSDVTVVAIDAGASASAQFSVRGTLESVEPGDSSITLNIDDETVSYYVADTAKVARNKLSATLVDLLEGDKVDAIIRVSADDSETVVAINATGRRVTERTVSLNGEIDAIDLGAGKIWLSNENGDDTELVVSDATAIRAGDQDATIDDLSPGDRVRVVARQRGATFTALTIRIAPIRRIEVEVTVSSVDLDESTVLLAIDGRGEDLTVSVTEASELAVDGTPVSLEELAAMDSIARQAVLIRRGAWWTLESLDASSYVEPDNGETCDSSVDSSCEPVVDPGCDVETDASCEPSEDPVAEAARLV